MKIFKKLINIIIIMIITLLFYSNVNNVYGTVSLDDISIPIKTDTTNKNSEDTSKSDGIQIYKPGDKKPVDLEDMEVDIKPDKEQTDTTNEKEEDTNKSDGFQIYKPGDKKPVGLEDIEVDIKPDKEQTDTTNEKEEQNLEDPITNPDFYKPTDTTGNNTKFIELGNAVIGTLRVIGTVVSVIAFMIIGLRYMLGSVSEKAIYKETLIPYLVGAIMVFTIPHVLGILYDLVKGIQL